MIIGTAGKAVDRVEQRVEMMSDDKKRYDTARNASTRYRQLGKRPSSRETEKCVNWQLSIRQDAQVARGVGGIKTADLASRSPSSLAD